MLLPTGEPLEGVTIEAQEGNGTVLGPFTTDENGAAIILKNNVPRYILMEFNQLEEEQLAGDEDIQEISKRLMAKNKHAYEVLAK